MEKICYICGRTIRECQDYIDSYIKNNMSELSRDPSIVAKLDRNCQAMRDKKRAQEYLSEAPETIVANAPQDIIDSYGHMTKGEFSTLNRYGGGRFSTEVTRILDSAFFCTSNSEMTLREIHKLCLERVDKLKAKADVDLPSDDKLAQEEVNKAYRIEAKMLELPVREEKSIKIPCCSICRAIIEMMASDIASIYAR